MLIVKEPTEKFNTEEIRRGTMYNPADSMFLDGACMLDGTKKLNSGREEL